MLNEEARFEPAVAMTLVMSQIGSKLGPDD